MTRQGFLHKTETGVFCRLRDQWGYEFDLTGVPAEEDGVRGYAVTVEMVFVPEWDRVPYIDDEQGRPIP